MKTKQVIFPQVNFRLLRTILFVGFVAQTLLACTNRDVTVTAHEGPVGGDEIVTAPKGPAVDLAALNHANPDSLLAKIQASQKTGGSALSVNEKVSILTSLEVFVLNRSYLEDPRVIHTKQMRAALRAFNESLVSLAEQNPDQAKPWIEKARIAIESGCDGLLKDCTNIRFFSGDHNSAKLMELSARTIDKAIDGEKDIAKRDDLVRTYYRRLKISFALRNRVSDSKFDFMYLMRASDYAETFSRSPKNSRERDLLTQHSEVFEMILNAFNPDLSDPKFKTQFESFVNAFSPWNYSRQTESPFGQAATRMLALAARDFLYDGKSNALSSSLVKAIKHSQETPPLPVTLMEGETNPFAHVDDSLANIESQFQKEEGNIWRDLSLKDTMPRDEYFYMIDRIYGGHLTPDDATEIWRGSRQDANALLKAAEQYIKIRVAAQIVRTNRYMSFIYSSQKYSSTDLFQMAIKNSFPIENQWRRMLDRIKWIQTFLERNLKAADDRLNSESYTHVDTMLTSITRNIKITSVYTNMMLMAYFLSEVKFKFPISTAFGSWELDAATIVSWFFEGNLRPVFKFGNDDVPLKRIETLYVFLFGLKTDAFKTFSVSKEKPLDLPRFFEVVIGKYLEADRLELQNALEAERKTMRQSNGMATFLQVCRQDRQLLAQGIRPGHQGTTLAIELDRLPFGTYVGARSIYGEDAWRFHSDSLTKRIKGMNDGLKRKLDFVKIMVDLLRQHLNIIHAPSDEVLRKIDGFLEGIRTLETEYLTELTRWNDTLSPCLDQSIAIEIDRQNDLVELEIQHLRSVWQHMTAIRAANGNSAVQLAAVQKATAYLNSTLALDELPSAANYKTVSEITGDEYVYAEFDVLLRLRRGLKKVAPNVRIIMPSDLTDTKMWKDRAQVIITYNENEELFVREALRNFNGSTGSYVKWLNTTGDATIFVNRVKLNTQLYRLGRFPVYNTSDISCQGKTNITECPKKIYEMSAKRLVDEMANITNMLSMTENGGRPKRDAQYLKMLGMTARWDKAKLADFMLDKNGEPISVFETLYMALTEEKAALEEALDYHTTEQAVGHFLFAPEAVFKEVLDGSFFRLVYRYFSRINELTAAIRAREQADAKAGRRLEYSYEWRENQMIGTSIETENGAPVYLARQKIADVLTRRRNFNEATKDAFNGEKKPDDWLKRVLEVLRDSEKNP